MKASQDPEKEREPPDSASPEPRRSVSPLVEEPGADRHVRTRREEAVHDLARLRRRVLAVAVEADDDPRPGAPRPEEPGLLRRRHSRVERELDDDHTALAGAARRLVGRAVAHDDDRPVRAVARQLREESGQRGLLVPGEDERDDSFLHAVG